LIHIPSTDTHPQYGAETAQYGLEIIYNSVKLSLHKSIVEATITIYGPCPTSRPVRGHAKNIIIII